MGAVCLCACRSKDTEAELFRFRLLEYRMGVRRQRDREAFVELDALIDSYLMTVRLSTYTNLQFLSLAGNRLNVASLEESGIELLKKLRMLDLSDNFIGDSVGEKAGRKCVCLFVSCV